MRKIIRIIVKIAIAAAAIFLLYFILTIEAVDTRLTSIIGNEREQSGALVYTEWSNELYETSDADKPCIFVRDERLMLAVGSHTADITPPDINIAYYGTFMDFNDTIKYKKNCIVSEDGRYIVYRLEFNEIPYLYYYDITLDKAFYITDRVDSFDIIENDGSDGLTLIYAAGYTQSNKLFVYSSDDTGETAGESVLISENISQTGVFEPYGCAVYLCRDGELYRYDAASRTTGKISDGVEKVYFPGNLKYNYDDYYNDFTVCCRKNGQDMIVNGASEAPVTYGYYGMIPKFTYKLDSGNVLYYTQNNMRLTLVKDGKATDLYEELGNIYHVFGYTDGYVIAASGDSLYLLKDDGNEAVFLMKLPLRYRRHTDMLEEHMRVYEANEGTFYVNMLTSGSLVMNTKNSESWMNAVNSYNYGLTALVRNGGVDNEDINYTACELALPPSRRMSEPASLVLSEQEGDMTYVSYFADGSVKAVSLISADGDLIAPDILGTSGLAEGQRYIEVFPCLTGTYFLVDTPGEAANREFYFLSEAESMLEPVYTEVGLLTEIYEDFTAETSFGTLVIFSKELYN